MKAVPHKSWKVLLENNDAATLWQLLHRLVAVHPLVRSAQRNQNNAKGLASMLSLTDLTQDLYVLLLEKARFTHYVQGDMTDADIEREIFQVELTNMLIGQLRRRQPENYRLARRIGEVLETNPLFRTFQQPKGAQPARYRQAPHVMYGLAEWADHKPLKESGCFEMLISSVPNRTRDRRRTGCKGDTQVIISTQELVDLLVEIFRAVDAPISMRTMRTLALSKLPVYDAVMASIDQPQTEGHCLASERLLIAKNACPEYLNLELEAATLARKAAHEYLARIDRLGRYQAERTAKYWRILWHFYFDPAQPSQLAIAAKLGMSDSSVSDYRRRMEQEMQRMLKADMLPEHFSYFAEELAAQLEQRLAQLELQTHVREKVMVVNGRDRSRWQPFKFNPLNTYERLPVV